MTEKESDSFDELEFNLDYDRTPKVLEITNDIFLLKLHNKKKFGMKYSINSNGKELVSGTLSANTSTTLDKIEFKEQVANRQVLKITYSDIFKELKVTILVYVVKKTG